MYTLPLIKSIKYPAKSLQFLCSYEYTDVRIDVHLSIYKDYIWKSLVTYFHKLENYPSDDQKC